MSAGARVTSSGTLSVIVPAWKRPESIARCLRALATQTRRPDEIVVVTRVGDAATRDAARAVALPAGISGRYVEIAEGGVIAAMQNGLDCATGQLIALTDDDAEPHPDWTARLIATFESDPLIGGAGGRDWQPHERGESEDVGRVQWFGRVIGRHHLGAGPARDVDVLKGVNCAFRAPLLRAVGFDRRLRGSGAQLHWELGVCLPIRRAGWRLVYDPAIAVDHHVESREGGDQFHRGEFAAGPFADAVFNESLLITEHLNVSAGFLGSVTHAIWSTIGGTTASPGLLSAVRLRVQGHRWAWEAWKAARRARAEAQVAARLSVSPPTSEIDGESVAADGPHSVPTPGSFS